jgi:hypothetical protein
MPVIEDSLPVTSVLEITTLSDGDRRQMFSLYSAYYCNSNETIFQSDLASKSYVILLHDKAAIQGFSTLALYEEEFEGSPIQVIYSGDTIIDKAYWGQPLLPKAWLQFAGRIAAQTPEIPLYWLLIVKGHRTYRYLKLFSQNYYPRYNVETPLKIQKMLNHLASRRFGAAYNRDNGLVCFPEPRSFLTPDLALIPEKDIKRPEVQFFLSKNPDYAQGDEMVCLCRLSPNNLTRLSLKWFMAGATESQI